MNEFDTGLNTACEFLAVPGMVSAPIDMLAVYEDGTRLPILFIALLAYGKRWVDNAYYICGIVLYEGLMTPAPEIDGFQGYEMK